MYSFKALGLFRVFLLAAMAVALVASLPAAAQDLRFQHITVDDGLSYQMVHRMMQDQRGYIWFGSHDGLNRFDGYTITTYLPNPEDPNALIHGDIEALGERRDGSVWVGTTRGLHRFDPATGLFKRFLHEPADSTSLFDNHIVGIYEDRRGILWVGTDYGLHRLDDATGTFTRYLHDPGNPASIGNGDVSMIKEGRDGTLWVGVGAGERRFYEEVAGGLYRMDVETGTFTRILYPGQKPDSEHFRSVSDIHETDDGVLWITHGEKGGGMIRWDRATDAITQYNSESGMSGNLGGIEEDLAGMLWVGAMPNGVYRVDPATGSFVNYKPRDGDPTSLIDGNTQSILAADDGTVWVASWEGVSWTDVLGDTFQQLFLRNTDVNAIYTTRDGTLYVGTTYGNLGNRDGLHRMEEQASSTRETPVFTSFPADPNGNKGPLHGKVDVLYETDDGMLWVGTWAGVDDPGTGPGLSRMDPATDTFVHYRHDPDDSTSLGPEPISALASTPDGSLWLGTSAGLSRMDRAAGSFFHFRHNPDDPTSQSLRGVEALCVTPDGALWVGTAQGLDRMDPSTEVITRYQYEASNPESLSHDWVRSCTVSQDGTLWVLTARGLDKLRTHADGTPVGFDRYAVGTTESLLGPLFLIEDDEGTHWIVMHSGRVVRFDPETGHYRYFGKDSGIWIGGIVGTAARHGERIYMGGFNGLLWINPARKQDRTQAPRLHLADLRLFGHTVEPGSNSPLSNALWATDTLSLAHNQNDLSIGYVGLHYADPKGNLYQYRVLPYDTDWRAPTTERRASYTLPPGAYTFEVKAASSDGVWTEAPLQLPIIIHSPWWRTTWAYVLYAVLFIVGAFTIDRVQRRRIVRRERQRAEIEQAELRERAAKAVAEIATSEARALKAENKRKEVELEKAHELEVAYDELDTAHKHLKATQDQLILSEKMASLGALTAGIAHEIKNPLNFVNNFAQINQELADELAHAIEAGESTDELMAILEDLKQGAEVINKQGKRADAIVKSMMEHASGGSGQREPTDVNALVEEYFNLAYHGMRAQDPAFNVALEREYSELVAVVKMVPQEIGRVLINLMNNAFYAVSEKTKQVNGGYVPTVRVVTVQEGEGVVIRVEDNGGGISAKDRAKIFEPFYTTKATGRGNTGLGLSLSYDIIAQGHGGTLKVESEEGEGATFIITLPA